MSVRPKRIVIIAYLFPPISSIGFQRPLRLANYLASRGDEVTVYCGHPSTYPDPEPIDTRLLTLVHPKIKVRRIPSIHGFQWLIGLRDRLRDGTASAIGATNSAPAADKARKPAAPGMLKRMVDGVMGAFSQPDAYGGWLLLALPLLLPRIWQGRPDAIYVTAPPWTPLLLGALAKRFSGVPLHLDMRDPWNFNPYHAGRRNPLTVSMEKWVVGLSDSVIANTASMADCYRKAFPGQAARIGHVYNGVDARTLKEMKALRDSADPKRPGLFTVSHIGTLYRSRMPAALARQLAAVAAGWKGEPDIRFRFVGWVEEPRVLEDAFREAKAMDRLEFAGQMSSAAAKAEQVRADVLLLLQSGTNLQVPAKVFEYVLTGNPILCVTEPESETAKLLNGYSLGMVCAGNEGPGVFASHLKGMTGTGGLSPEMDRFLEDFDGDRLCEKMRLALFGSLIPK